MFPNHGGEDDIKDAHRHCTWSALITKRANAAFAKEFTDAHEDGIKGNPADKKAMDKYNNAKGRSAASPNDNKSDRWMATTCRTLATQGELQNAP